MPALFVTGTDTGVGKTVVTALLTRTLRTLGADCVAMKPFASGCESIGGVLESEDATFLRAVGGFDAPLELVCPIRLEPPLAPWVAAQQRGLATSRWPELAREAFAELKQRHEWVLVEGVGGWCVPLWQRDDGGLATCADLVSDWNIPVIIVARRTLGTINHTTLTCRAVRERAELWGVVFCDSEPVEGGDIAALSSPAIACQLAHVPDLALVPYTTDWNEAARALEPFARELLSC